MSHLILPLFWLALALVVVSQAMILVSTVRALRSAAAVGGSRPARMIEWAYAIVPAVALAVALFATWEAARTHATHAELETRASLMGPP